MKGKMFVQTLLICLDVWSNNWGSQTRQVKLLSIKYSTGPATLSDDDIYMNSKSRLEN